ncbi:uncharacterized protein VTP21DRAFT_3809 [Calcarisporiella thermophila]|uniref:uncharacterized protein n=1 Tax=Calcarisporiella thermophila TaxID=911321 RepID=UPI00374226A1
MSSNNEADTIVMNHTNQEEDPLGYVHETQQPSEETKKRIDLLHKEVVEMSSSRPRMSLSDKHDGTEGLGISLGNNKDSSLLPPPPSTTPKRRTKMAPAPGNHDVQFVSEIAETLLNQVRNYQAKEVMWDKERKELAIRIQELELENESFKKQIQQKTQAEENLKSINWDLECSKGDLMEKLEELQRALEKSNNDQAKLQQSNARVTEQIEAARAKEDQLNATIDELRSRHEQEMFTSRKRIKTLQQEGIAFKKEVDELKKELESSKRFVRLRKGEMSTAPETIERDETDLLPAPRPDTPTETPPASPIKSPTKSQSLQVETLKNSLQHAQRAYHHCRNLLAKEKSEKMELRKMLTEREETIERMRQQGNVWEEDSIAKTPSSHRSRSRHRSSSKKRKSKKSVPKFVISDFQNGKPMGLYSEGDLDHQQQLEEFGEALGITAGEHSTATHPDMFDEDMEGELEDSELSESELQGLGDFDPSLGSQDIFAPQPRALFSELAAQQMPPLNVAHQETMTDDIPGLPTLAEYLAGVAAFDAALSATATKVPSSPVQPVEDSSAVVLKEASVQLDSLPDKELGEVGVQYDPIELESKAVQSDTPVMVDAGVQPDEIAPKKMADAMTQVKVETVEKAVRATVQTRNAGVQVHLIKETSTEVAPAALSAVAGAGVGVGVGAIAAASAVKAFSSKETTSVVQSIAKDTAETSATKRDIGSSNVTFVHKHESNGVPHSAGSMAAENSISDIGKATAAPPRPVSRPPDSLLARSVAANSAASEATSVDRSTPASSHQTAGTLPRSILSKKQSINNISSVDSKPPLPPSSDSGHRRFGTFSSAHSFSTMSSDFSDNHRLSSSSMHIAPPQQPPTSGNIIHAITQTMIGEFMWKYTRRSVGSGLSERRHRRFFWVHPYTNTLYWSTMEPGVMGNNTARIRSAAMESVYTIVDHSQVIHGLPHVSLVVKTPHRSIKITAPSIERHDLWLQSLTYLLERQNGADGDSSQMSGGEQTSRAPGSSNGTLNRPGPKKQRSFQRIQSLFTPRKDLSSESNSALPGLPSESRDVAAGQRVDRARNPEEDDDEEDEEIENVWQCCGGRHDLSKLDHSRHRHDHFY